MHHLRNLQTVLTCLWRRESRKEGVGWETECWGKKRVSMWVNANKHWLGNSNSNEQSGFKKKSKTLTNSSIEVREGRDCVKALALDCSGKKVKCRLTLDFIKLFMFGKIRRKALKEWKKFLTSKPAEGKNGIKGVNTIQNIKTDFYIYGISEAPKQNPTSLATDPQNPELPSLSAGLPLCVSVYLRSEVQLNSAARLSFFCACILCQHCLTQSSQ